MAKKDEDKHVPATTHEAPPPSFINKGETRGMEAATKEDYAIPRIAIAQGLSPQLNKTKPEYIEGLQQGDIFNLLTRHVYGPSIRVVPILMFHSRFLFKPQEEGGGILCRSNNGIDGGTECDLCERCPHNRWPSGDKMADKDICTAFTNYLSFIMLEGGKKDLAVIGMKSTQLKVAKAFNSLINMRKTDSFAGLYALDTVSETNPRNQTYFNYRVDNAGWVDEATYHEAEKIYADFAGKDIKVADPVTDPEAGTAGDDI